MNAILKQLCKIAFEKKKQSLTYHSWTDHHGDGPYLVSSLRKGRFLGQSQIKGLWVSLSIDQNFRLSDGNISTVETENQSNQSVVVAKMSRSMCATK